MDEQLSTSQVASALQVSESSIKRWCDRGVIPTVRTAGGHRRIPMDGLMEFLESTNRQLVNPDYLTSRSDLDSESLAANKTFTSQERDTLKHEFEEAIIKGDERHCRKILTHWYAMEKAFAPIADCLLASAFHTIGELWDCEKVDVYQERRACQICSRILHELRRIIPEPPAIAPLAIGGTPAGDHYTLANTMVELVLRESGWRTTNLGDNVPLESMKVALLKYQPRLFWLSVSHIDDEQAFVRDFQNSVESLPREVAIVVGGRALSDSIRPKLRYTAHCDNLRQLAEFATAIRGGKVDLKVSNN